MSVLHHLVYIHLPARYHEKEENEEKKMEKIEILIWVLLLYTE